MAADTLLLSREIVRGVRHPSSRHVFPWSSIGQSPLTKIASAATGSRKATKKALIAELLKLGSLGRGEIAGLAGLTPYNNESGPVSVAEM